MATIERYGAELRIPVIGEETIKGMLQLLGTQVPIEVNGIEVGDYIMTNAEISPDGPAWFGLVLNGEPA